jgi:hypothetical protein
MTSHTPNSLASRLVGAEEAEKFGKQMRAFLRAMFPRDPSLKGSNWTMSDEQVATVTAWHKARQNGARFDVDTFRKAYRARKRAPKKAPAETPNES